MSVPPPALAPSKWRSRIGLRAIVDLACLVSIVASLWFVSRSNRSSTVAAREEPAKREDHWGEALAVANFTPGDRTEDSLVIISDYQCEGCRRLHSRLTEWLAREDVPATVGIIHYPLAYHPHAKAAAHAALCGESIGAFKRVHEALMDSAESVDRGMLTFLAPLIPESARPDFLNCLQSGGMMPALERHIRLADAVGVVGTPTLLVNGWRVSLPNSPADLHEWLRLTRAGRSPY